MKSISKQLSKELANLMYGSLRNHSNYNEIKRQLEDFLLSVTDVENEVPIEEFIDLYDMRAYNFDSKREDIKVLKKYKLTGAYALYNVDKNIYYTGYSNDVFRKVDRHFRGYENIKLYDEWQNGDKFIVKMSFCDEDVDNPILLKKELDDYCEDRRLFILQILEEQKLEEENKKIQKMEDKKRRKTQRKNFINKYYKILILLIIVFFITLIAGYFYNIYKNSLSIEYSKEELIGIPYNSVKTKLSMLGFSNIDYSNIEDLELKEISKDGIVSNIFIDGKYYDFNNKNKILSNKRIVIEYHSLKRISFPYSSKDIIGNNYLEVVRRLKKSGFFNIVCKPKKDLIIGLLNKKNEIFKVAVNGKEKYSKNIKVKPDDKILIEYHTFKK